MSVFSSGSRSQGASATSTGSTERQKVTSGARNSRVLRVKLSCTQSEDGTNGAQYDVFPESLGTSGEHASACLPGIRVFFYFGEELLESSRNYTGIRRNKIIWWPSSFNIVPMISATDDHRKNKGTGQSATYD